MDNKPIVGQGHPLDPDRHKVLSRDDEKRVDEKGVSVVDGKLWSDSGTGMYLIIGLSQEPLLCSQVVTGRSELNLGNGYTLTMGVSAGKPTFTAAVVGACLELPDDLGDDPKKKQYVIEWICHTVIESLADRGIALDSKLPFTMNLMECVAHASDIAIGEVGL